MSLINQIALNESNRPKTPGSVDFRTLLPQFGEHYKRRLIDHHKLYDCAPKGTLLENILVRILNDEFGLGELVNGLVFGWKPESHSISSDMTVPSLITPSISCKSGKVTGTTRKKNVKFEDAYKITFNSHRLTRFGTIQERQNFLGQKHYDVMVCLGFAPKLQSYQLLVIDNLDLSPLVWVETYSKDESKEKKLTGWTAAEESQGIIKAKISNSLSSQLWIELALNSNRIVYRQDIPLKEIIKI